jgi:hypothetical protein
VTRKMSVAKGPGANDEYAYATRNSVPRSGRHPSRRALVFSENLGLSGFSSTVSSSLFESRALQDSRKSGHLPGGSSSSGTPVVAVAPRSSYPEAAEGGR